jgi:hypothetical protein
MADVEHDRLVAHLTRRAGDCLRIVGRYTPDDYELAYVRDDVREQHSVESFEAVVDDLREQATRQGSAESTYRLGDRTCTMQVFSEGLVLNFADADTERAAGTALALDPDAATRLTGFVEECQQRIA